MGTPDLNGDGIPDLLFQNISTGQLYYDTFNGSTVTPGGSIGGALGANWALVGVPDLNGDGHPDLLVENKATGDIAYYLMNGVNGIAAGYISKGVGLQWSVAGIR